MSVEQPSIAECVQIIADRLKAFRVLMASDQCMTQADYYMLDNIPEFSKEELAQYFERLAPPANFLSEFHTRTSHNPQEETSFPTFEALQVAKPSVPEWWRLFYEHTWRFLLSSPAHAKQVGASTLHGISATLASDPSFVDAARLILLEHRLMPSNEILHTSVAFAIVGIMLVQHGKAIPRQLNGARQFCDVYRWVVSKPDDDIPSQTQLYALMSVHEILNKKRVQQ